MTERRRSEIEIIRDIDKARQELARLSIELLGASHTRRVPQAAAPADEQAGESTYYGARILQSGLAIHAADKCVGSRCVFHNPSPHHMITWPINVRLDRFGALAERICPHGVGHPDPDSLDFVETLHEEAQRGYEGVHGCDSCCDPRQKR